MPQSTLKEGAALARSSREPHCPERGRLSLGIPLLGGPGVRWVSLTWPAEYSSLLSVRLLCVRSVSLSACPGAQPSPPEAWKEQSPYQDAHG